MADPDAPVSEDTVEKQLAFGVTDPNALTANRRAFTIMVRNYFFHVVELFALEKEETLDELIDYLDDKPDVSLALDDYFDDYDDVDLTTAARGKEYFRVEEDGRSWHVRQIIKDPEDDRSFAFVGTVDLDASDAEGEVRLSSLVIEQN